MTARAAPTERAVALSRLGHRRRRAVLGVTKVVWGAQRVGTGRVLRGVTRLLWLRVRNPTSTTTHSRRHDLHVTLRYPSQVIPTLLVFDDLLEPELDLLPAHLGPGAVAVDVGASVGTWSMVAARTGATVLACEPDDENLTVLRENLLANRLDDRVVVRPLAVGRRSGTGSLLRRTRRYLNSLEETCDTSDGDRVTVLTLPELLDREDVEVVDVLKVNTAGHEAEVLEGAAPAFRDGRVRLAMLLDGLAVRAAIQEGLLDGSLSRYDVAAYDDETRELVRFADVDALASRHCGPMSHYVILLRRSDGAPS